MLVLGPLPRSLLGREGPPVQAWYQAGKGRVAVLQVNTVKHHHEFPQRSQDLHVAMAITEKSSWKLMAWQLQ